MTYGGAMSAGAMLRALGRVEEHLRLRHAADREAMLAEIRTDPLAVMTTARLTPDLWQAGVLRSQADRMMLLCSRQCFDADTVVLDRTGRAMRICHHPAAWPTDTRPVRRYTVRGGAAVALTDNHPLWTKCGWAPAGTIGVGDKIAVLSHWDRWPAIDTLRSTVQHGTWVRPWTTDVAFPAAEALGRVLGYFATDGSNRPGQSIKFTNTRPEYLAELAALVHELTGVSAKWYPKGRGADLLFTTTKARHDNRLMDLMRAVRWDSRFPTDVFAFPAAAAAAFVNRAWAGDGCVRQLKTGHPEIFLACKNAVYGRYFQLLLMKFGVHSRIATEWMKKSTQPFHRLVLGCGRANVERFFAVVGPIYGKEVNSDKALAFVRGTSKAQDYRKLDHEGADGEAFHLAQVVKIEDLGEREVWDVEVPGKGWLVAQGVKAHNSGKSTVSSALAVHTALTKPNAPVLLLSPSQRQSGELFRKVLTLYAALGHPVPAVRETALQLELANGSRILSLPGTEQTIRGFSEVALLVIDEAARVSDSLYYAVRPMLAVSKGRLVALSTPFGQRGWFFEEWRGAGAWERVRITADQVPRITPEFLAEERKALGDRWWSQEYGCDFQATIDAVFDPADIAAALADDVKPLFG